MDDADAPVSYWPADPRLSGLVTGYHRYRIAAPAGHSFTDMMFPSWTTVRIAIDDAAPWSMKIGARIYDPMPSAAVTGPSSFAGECTGTQGTLVGVGILPAGWVRLFGGDVSLHSNRVARLDAIAPEAPELQRALAAAENPRIVFDEWLLKRLGAGNPPDPLVDRIYALINNPEQLRIEELADAIGLSVRTLGITVRRNFGFTPKLLLRRGRFLRALAAALADPDGDWNGILSRAGYWDRSHFLRDSHQFLGGSIRDFLARRGAINTLAMQVRGDVLGAAV